MHSFPFELLTATTQGPGSHFSGSWLGTLLSGTLGAVIGAAAAVVSAILVARRSYTDQRRIAAEGRARRAAVEFLSALHGLTNIKTDRQAAVFRNELDAAATLWVIEEEEAQLNARVLTRAILKVFSDEWRLDAKDIESLLERSSPLSGTSHDLYTSGHAAVLGLLEGKGDDAVRHFLVSFGMEPDGQHFLN